MLLDDLNHQPHRIIQNPLPHIRWQQQRLIPIYPPIALRHDQFSNANTSQPCTNPPTRAKCNSPLRQQNVTRVGEGSDRYQPGSWVRFSTKNR